MTEKEKGSRETRPEEDDVRTWKKGLKSGKQKRKMAHTVNTSFLIIIISMLFFF